jgi:hypothetical protein
LKVNAAIDVRLALGKYENWRLIDLNHDFEVVELKEIDI